MKGCKCFGLIVIIGTALIFVGCAAPRTFVRTADAGWNTIEIRENLTYDEVWTSVVDLLARRFDLEVLSKDDGYVRTGWLFSWTGRLEDNYRVRGVIKFSPDRKRIEVKSEAHHYNPGFLYLFGRGWELGTDELLITTLRTDIMGKVGRVSR